MQPTQRFTFQCSLAEYVHQYEYYPRYRPAFPASDPVFRMYVRDPRDTTWRYIWDYYHGIPSNTLFHLLNKWNDAILFVESFTHRNWALFPETLDQVSVMTILSAVSTLFKPQAMARFQQPFLDLKGKPKGTAFYILQCYVNQLATVMLFFFDRLYGLQICSRQIISAWYQWSETHAGGAAFVNKLVYFINTPMEEIAYGLYILPPGRFLNGPAYGHVTKIANTWLPISTMQAGHIGTAPPAKREKPDSVDTPGIPGLQGYTPVDAEPPVLARSNTFDELEKLLNEPDVVPVEPATPSTAAIGAPATPSTVAADTPSTAAMDSPTTVAPPPTVTLTTTKARRPLRQCKTITHF